MKGEVKKKAPTLWHWWLQEMRDLPMVTNKAEDLWEKYVS